MTTSEQDFVYTKPQLKQPVNGEVDYLIIGQGLSGTLLSFYLTQRRASVMVIDDGDASSASRVASGVINPVTGKRLVRSWMIAQLQPNALFAYAVLSEYFEPILIKQCSIFDFHLTREQQDIFIEKQTEESKYLQNVIDTEPWTRYFRFNYGIGQVIQSLLIDVGALLTAWRAELQIHNCLLPERFSWSDCIVGKSRVIYKHIAARKIIFCDGAACEDNPYFNMLPWSRDKGEALIASIPGLPADNIYKQGISIVPWHDDLFWVGATHDWKFTDMHPTEAFRKKTEEHLNYWLKLPYEVKDHLVAQRPTNLERKPFMGIHPLHSNIGILNGMGTKGCSLAPYFAQQFAGHLTQGTPLQPDVDIKRFAKLLSR